jgi:hypothetical protein
MSKQTNLEKIGFERRNEHELIRNDIKKNKPYSDQHDSALWHEGDEEHPLGKGTKHQGHQHTVPQPYNTYTLNTPSHQLDTDNGGGSYDINGRPGVGGGRKWLEAINLYDKTNPYGVNSIDTEANVLDDQFFIK